MTQQSLVTPNISPIKDRFLIYEHARGGAKTSPQISPITAVQSPDQKVVEVNTNTDDDQSTPE
jgi:hypothetical protein